MITAAAVRTARGTSRRMRARVAAGKNSGCASYETSCTLTTVGQGHHGGTTYWKCAAWTRSRRSATGNATGMRSAGACGRSRRAYAAHSGRGARRVW